MLIPARTTARTHQENTAGGNSFNAEISYNRAINDYWELKNTMKLSTADSHGVLTIIDGSNERTMTRSNTNNFYYSPYFVFQKGNWEANLEGNVQITHNFFQEDAVSAFTLYRYGGGAYVQYTFFKHLTVYLDGELIGRKGYNTDRFNRDDFVMNAAIWYKLLKNKLTLRIDANNIFNKDISWNSSESSTSRAESTYANQIHHYLMFTIQYDFDAKGGWKK